MPPQLALFICILFILFLLIADYRHETNVSYGLWVPTLWMMIIGSRFVSRWLDISREKISIETFIEGSPIDMYVFIILIFVGILILARRKIFWSEMIRDNRWIFGLLVYAGISVIWSDYTFVAFKRWVKEVGNIIMVLVVLTEGNRVEAIKRMIKRVAYVLIPLSIVLYKYYPAFGRIYHRWSGEMMVVGVTTHKNELGVLSMVCALFLLWDIFSSWKSRNFQITNRKYFFEVIVFLMALWLLIKCESATSIMAFIFGSCIMISLGIHMVRNNLKSIDGLIIIGIVIFMIFELAFDIHKYIISGLGREETLTGRVDFWKLLVPMVKSPIIGTGFESFWLGSRLEILWEKYWWYPNQAHNGYLEVYLNLGALGLFLLIGVILSVYGKIRRNIFYDFSYGRLQMAFLGITLIYNITEASFQKLHLVWFIFLIIGIWYSPLYKIDVEKREKLLKI